MADVGGVSVDEPRPASSRAESTRRCAAVASSPGSAWRFAVPLVLALAGFLVVTTAHTARGTDLRSERRTDVADLVREQARRAEAGQRDLQRLRDQVDALSA